MHLTKHHALGNDFLVSFVDEVPVDAVALAVAVCDRRTGVGADGLMLGIDTGSRPVMRLWNSDGSVAEISGNGLRCFGQAVAMRRGVSEIDVDVDTAAGLRRCVIQATDDPSVVAAAADMGVVTAGDEPDGDFDSVLAAAGVSGVRGWALGAVGNPHVVIELDDPTSVDLAHAGPIIEQAFPQGVNAHFVTVAGPDQIDLRVWERGAGVTLACGSGATVSAQRMHDWGRVGESVAVAMPGGTARVDVMTDDRSTALLHGPATFVASLEVPRG